MAQGKLKVKAKKPAQKKSDGGKTKAGKVAKKGRKVIAPKRAGARQAYELSRKVEKGINKKIEQTLAQRAKQVEEGKAFAVLKTDEAGKK